MNSALEATINGWAGSNGFLDRVMIFSAADLIFFAVPLLALLWFWPGQPKQRALNQRIAAAAGMAGVLGLAIAAVVSHLHMELRPFVAQASTHLLVKHAPDNSFPSDHATASFAVGSAIVWWRRTLGVGTLIAALLIGFARVFTGLHWPVDIVVGDAIGVAAGCFMAWTVPVWAGLQRQVSRYLPEVLVARSD